MRKAEMKANGLENRKLTASPQWSMFKRIKIDDNDFLHSSNLVFCPTKGAFNNYVDKKRGRGGQPKVHACPLRGGGVP